MYTIDIGRLAAHSSQHQVKRVKLSPQALEAKKEKERSKIQEFLALSEDILQRVR